MDPIKFTEMELVDDENVETMVALYCETRSNQNASIQLFAELVGVEATEDLTPLGEEDGVQEPCMVVPISYVDSQSTIHGIDIDLNAAPETDVVGDDVYYSSDPADHEVDSESDPDVDEVLDDIDDEGVNEDGYINASSVGNQIRLQELEPHIFHQRMARLESDIEGQTNTSFRQWLGTMEPWRWAQSFDKGFRYSQMTTNLVEGINAVLLKTRHLPISFVFSTTFYRLATLMPRMGQQQVNQMEAGHVFVEDVRDVMVANRRMARSYGVDLRNRQCDYKSYTVESMLCVWENEFPVLLDLSTWEVPLTTFELVPNKGLRRNPEGRLQSSRIHNEMDIREKSDEKLCGVCRVADHNRSKCPFRNYHVGQSGVRNIDKKSYVSNVIDELEPGGVEYDDGYGLEGGVEYDGGYEPRK
ncbi:hypothetical protein GOBAR_DD01519 [Gossypium barbadense]|nr:hypothetical protein GOBAR_DD01519 [Gossypium barbadense]